MKITDEDLEYVAYAIRQDFDTCETRFRADFQRYEYRMELIERAKRFGLTDLVTELKSDIRVE